MRGSNWRIVELACVLAIPSGALAGDLNPPGGNVLPTMKTLVDVEPRIAVNATNTPGDAVSEFVISSPGSYYLTGELIVAPGKNGIAINSHDVVLDLNGFTLSGPNLDLFGIVGQQGGSNNVTVRNGIVREFAVGLAFSGSLFCQFENLRIVDTLAAGISSGFYATVIDCTAANTGDTGFLGRRSLWIRCIAYSTGNKGFALLDSGTVVNCAAYYCSSTGFSFGAVDPDNFFNVINCLARGNGGGGFGGEVCRFEGCVAAENQGGGFFASQRSMFTNCLAVANSTYGFFVLEHSRVEGCHSADNGEWGIVIRALTSVLNCSVANNGSGGIQSEGNAMIIGNMVVDNGTVIVGGPGIEITGAGGNIDSNIIANNDGEGLDLSDLAAIGNVFTRNRFTGNAMAIDPGVGNVTGGTTATPDTAGPWANIEH